jgi:catechol 2,3-dioxygenase-like lactoylglutathione lyase family enzyme
MTKIICGIQQMGIGVPDVQEIWRWYRAHFGVDVRIFEEAAEAPLMTRYTGDKVHARTATLALSMEGGGGFEIWQFTSRPTEKSKEPILLGDFGLYACRIKSKDVQHTYRFLKNKGANVLSEPQQLPNGQWHFLVMDPNGNLFDIVEGSGWFMDTKFEGQTGGVAGSMIGVSDIEKALPLYQKILGYTEIAYDTTCSERKSENTPRVVATSGSAQRSVCKITWPYSNRIGSSRRPNRCKIDIQRSLLGRLGLHPLVF